MHNIIYLNINRKFHFIIELLILNNKILRHFNLLVELLMISIHILLYKMFIVPKWD